MIILLYSLHTLTLGLPAQPSRSGPCDAQEIYDQFLIAQEARQLVLRQHRITFTERSVRMTDHRPLGAAAGYVDFSGNREKWVRWDIPAVASAAIHAIECPVAFAERARDIVRPNVDISDGTQTVLLAPVGSKPKHWDGLLVEGLSPVIRRGALNCGVLFYEQWVTSFLSRHQAKECATQDNGLTRLTLVPNSDPGGPRSLQIDIDDDLFCHSMVIRMNGSPRVEAHVDTRTLVLGEPVPATGHVLFHYETPVLLRAELHYAPSAGLVEESYLETLPSEIHELGGTASVTDQAGRFIRHLRAPGEVDPPQQDSIPQTPPAVEATEPDGERPKGNWTGPLAAGVASIAAVALFLALRRR